MSDTERWFADGIAGLNAADRRAMKRCTCGLDDACERHAVLTPVERAAAQALYEDDEVEVGHEGIGGFYPGQAEETILALRRAGFRIDRGSDRGSADATGSVA